MLKKRRKKALEEGHTNNIWNRHDFVICGLGEKSRTLAIVKHIRRCIKWSKIRISGICMDICRYYCRTCWNT